jgi:hypothetical protein
MLLVWLTETSHLIGQWLPVDPATSGASLQPSIQLLVWQVVRLVLTSAVACSTAMPAVSTSLNSLLCSLPSDWLSSVNCSEFSAFKGHAAKILPNSLLEQVLQHTHVLLQLLSDQQLRLSPDVSTIVRKLQQRVYKAQHKLEEPVVQGMTFSWVDAPLVTAMREGHWVRYVAQHNSTDCLLQSM